MDELEKLTKQYFKDCEEYQKQSVEFEKTMKTFYIGRIEQGRAGAYKSKTPFTMSDRMRKTEEKARKFKKTINDLNTFTMNYKKKMRHNFQDLIQSETDWLQQTIDALNKLLIFQTNFDMNNKYDTNGFADLINEIKIDPEINQLKDECAKHGGSIEDFKHMITLKF